VLVILFLLLILILLILSVVSLDTRQFIGDHYREMDHAQHPHPTLTQLQAFDSGQLAPAEQAPIERHLETCTVCCDALGALPESGLEALLRSCSGPSERSDFTPLAEACLAGSPKIPAALVGHPRYRVLEVLGAGGMGVVYKAVHRLMERVVALKVINQLLTARPGFVERFRREVKAAARLAHPNIVTAYDAEEAGGTHFLVMEYVIGTNMDREVARRGPLPVREACDLVRQAALGLQHAYERGMVHCDIKPHNLLLTPGGQVKILDFGLARIVDEGSGEAPSLASGTFVGTPDYVAPEQARDPGRADIRADIYSLGCTLYHLLSGKPPFPAGTPLQKLLAHQECNPPPLTARDDVPLALTRILERMLAKDPARRYATPADVAADLARLEDPSSAPPAPASRRSARRVLLRVAAVLAVVGALALVAFLVLPGLLRPPTSPGEEVSAPVEPPAKDGGRDPAALADAPELARQKREARDGAVDWLRANIIQKVVHAVSADVASHIDKDLDAGEAFQVLLGPGLVKSSKATLLLGRAGALHVFELEPALAPDVSPGGCRVQNYSAGNDRRRAVPRIVLSGLVVEGADHLFPEQRVKGSVAYQLLSRWPGEYALRLTFYFGKHKRDVLLRRGDLPDADRGTLRFSFPPLDAPDEVMPGPDAVFVEVITQAAGQVVVESNAAAVGVRVMPATAARP
jgi:hypothetical protein